MNIRKDLGLKITCFRPDERRSNYRIILEQSANSSLSCSCSLFSRKLSPVVNWYFQFHLWLGCRRIMFIFYIIFIHIVLNSVILDFYFYSYFADYSWFSFFFYRFCYSFYDSRFLFIFIYEWMLVIDGF